MITTNAKMIYSIKERIQDLEDEKNRLIVDTLKHFGWTYSDKLKGQSWLWHKIIEVDNSSKEVFLSQDQAWSFQLWQTLKEEM